MSDDWKRQWRGPGVGFPEGFIEAIEARGQADLVNSTNLPVKGSSTPAEVADLEALGFRLGPVLSDSLFRTAVLPPGWTRSGSDHNMWSYIVDSRGIDRVAIFYKAAPYDRQAHMSLSDVGYAAYTAFLDRRAAVPWDLLTPQERESAITAFRQGVDRMEQAAKKGRQYPDEPAKIERLKAELARVTGDVAYESAQPLEKG